MLSVNSCRSSLSHSGLSTLPEGQRGRQAERTRAVQQPFELAWGDRRALHAGAGHDLVGLADDIGQGGHFAVGDRASQATQGLVQTVACGDLDTDVDLLVRHAAPGEVALVLQQVVTPAGQRGWRVRVMGGGPRADGVGPGGDPDVDVAPDQLGVGVGGVDDQLLADGFGSKRPALRVKEVPGVDLLRGDGAVAADAAQRQTGLRAHRVVSLFARGATLSPAQACGDGLNPSRAVCVGRVPRGFARRVDLVGERSQNRTQRAVVVDHAQDQPGQANRCQEAVGQREEPQADPKPALDRLEQDEDDQPDAVGDVPAPATEGSCAEGRARPR